MAEVYLATRNTWKDKGLDGTSESASTCHTLFILVPYMGAKLL